MGTHRRPTPHPPLTRRLNTSPTALRTVAGCAAVLTVAAVVGGANGIGDDFTPAAQATATPPAEDVGQRGMRGLPTPARIFPTDLDAPDYPVGDPTIGLSSPRSGRTPVAGLPVTPTPTPDAAQVNTEGSLATVTTDETTTAQAAQTTAEPTEETSPTSPTTVTTTPEETDVQPTTTTEPPTDVGGLINEPLEDMP